MNVEFEQCCLRVLHVPVWSLLQARLFEKYSLPFGSETFVVQFYITKRKDCYIPTRASGCVARNGTVHARERVAMRPSHSIYYPHCSALAS